MWNRDDAVSYLNHHDTLFSGKEGDRFFSGQLEKMQRVAHVAPRYDQMRALMTSKLDSALSIANLSPEHFENDYEGTLGGIDAAAKVHEATALPNASHGRCAEFTRNAIEAGGVTLAHHTSAKDYGSSLRAVGFVSLGQSTGPYEAGDVGIVSPIPHHPHGHMAMFNGEIWISDFKQSHGLYSGHSHWKTKPPFAIYRYGSANPIS